MGLQQMSFSASMMIAFIILIRCAAINRLCKKTFMVLWAAVVARLIVPFNLPSRLSVYSLAENLAGFVKGLIYTKPLETAPAVFIKTAAVNEQSGISVWSVVWFAGAVLAVVWFVSVYVRCKREFDISLPAENSYIDSWIKNLGGRRRITVRIHEKIMSPLTYGIIRPVILLPKDMDFNNLTNLEYILTHEYVHIKRFDCLWKILLTAVVCIHWFNPAVWAMYVFANRDIELCCDETVVGIMGEGKKSDYALALINMEETKRTGIPMFSSFSREPIEERINAIMKIKKASVLSLCAALALTAGTTTVFATSKAVPELKNITTTTAVSARSIDISSKEYTSDSAKLKIVSEDVPMKIKDIQWWTYDEYKSWLDNEKKEIEKQVKEGTQTRKTADDLIDSYEQTLDVLKNGNKVSKSVDGDKNLSITINEADLKKLDENVVLSVKYDTEK